MFRYLLDPLYVMLKLGVIILINFSFFVLIPITHDLFGQKIHVKENGSSQRILAELVRPPKKEPEKKSEQRIRQVKTESGRSSVSGNSQLKFSPDLGIESGEGVAIASADVEAAVFEDGQTDEEAVPVNTPPVAFPQRARELGIEGMAEAIIVIDIDGSVSSIEITTSPHPTIAAEMRKTINTWKFKPARNQGVPVKIRKKQVIEFRLDA